MDLVRRSCLLCRNYAGILKDTERGICLLTSQPCGASGYILFRLAALSRANDHMCGKSGRFFEPRGGLAHHENEKN